MVNFFASTANILAEVSIFSLEYAKRGSEDILEAVTII